MHANSTKHDQFERQRQQILETVAEQIRLQSLRSISMANLAKSLGISTKTLYRHFPTKSNLVLTILEEQASQFQRRRAQRLERGENAHQRIALLAQEWLELRNALGEMFIRDLQIGFPDAHLIYQKTLGTFLRESRQNLEPEIRAGIHADNAMMLLWKIISDIPPAEACEKMGMTRKQVLLQGIEIWARGSLRMYQ